MQTAALPLRSWETWLSQAMEYEKAAGGTTTPSRFSPAIQYNLIALALEGYVMAMASRHGSLPENHTFTDLIRAWERVEPLDPALKSVILKYEDMQSICSLDGYRRFEPTLRDIQELRTAVSALGKIAKQACLPGQAGAK